MAENPESPIRLPYEVRRKLGRLRLLIASLEGLVSLMETKVGDLEKTLDVIDKTVKAKQKALETKEDIEVFEAYIEGLTDRLVPFQGTFRDKIRQLEDQCDRLEELV